MNEYEIINEFTLHETYRVKALNAEAAFEAWNAGEGGEPVRVEAFGKGVSVVIVDDE